MAPGARHDGPSPRPIAAGGGVAVLVAALVAASLAAPAVAWDSKGHDVIEALAYRTLVEGHGMPPSPDVLRDLMNDGALTPAVCFGRGDPPPRECADAAKENPLLAWPEPQTDRPDAFFRRQFSDSGQCFHYMAPMSDALTEPLPGRDVPRGLATRAVVRCNDLLAELLRQVVVDGGPGTRRSGFGLYELMHAVEDSFSGAHAQRAGASVDYLRVWKPIERIAPFPSEEMERVPADAFHEWDDERDKTYVARGDPLACEKRVDDPYDVPYDCLSPDGDAARQAVTELLVVVRDLRRAQRAAPAGMDTHPESSPAWRAYQARWFAPAVPCAGEECAARQPPEHGTGRYAFLGMDARFESPGTWEASARGTLLRFAEELNPFVYTLSASLGYQYGTTSGSAGLVGLGVGLGLPLGLRTTIALTAAEVRFVYGGSAGGVQLLTRLLRLDYVLGEQVGISFEAPMVVNWAQPAVHWGLGVGVSFGLSSPRMVSSDTLLHHDDAAERHDDGWVPPPAPYGRLQGRRASFGAFVTVSPTTTPPQALEGRAYGLGALGAEVTWDRDAWKNAFAFTPVVSLAAGLRNTNGDSSYLTFTLGLGVRWYFLGPLGLTVTAVRLEGGPKVRGVQQVDGSAGVHGPPGGEYYFLPGSRAGIALRLGVLDLVVEGPTIAWTSQPFGADEILGFTLALRI
jgi:hypothetical protein